MMVEGKGKASYSPYSDMFLHNLQFYMNLFCSSIRLLINNLITKFAMAQLEMSLVVEGNIVCLMIHGNES